MTQTSLSQPLRGELVRAAETVLDKQGGLPRNPENSQLSRLVQVTGEAACIDEIANYLRYQGARGRWKRSLAEDVIDAIHPLLGSLDSEPERVAAWRLYATYLRRAYYYRREVNRDLERSRRKEGPPQRAAQPHREQPHAREEGPPGEGGKRRRQRRRGKRPGAPGEAGAPPTEAGSSAAEGHAEDASFEQGSAPEDLAAAQHGFQDADSYAGGEPEGSSEAYVADAAPEPAVDGAADGTPEESER